jgi:CheY-like chemotaxis protein/DNA-binding CsgD family transcriptional regulator
MNQTINGWIDNGHNSPANTLHESYADTLLADSPSQQHTMNKSSIRSTVDDQTISPQQEQAVVLIVDDMPDNLSLLYTLLEQAGYIVLVATDGQTALERVAKFAPDAILLDAMMPGLNGFDTCRLLKTNPLTQYIPVIFMTGLTESEYVVNGFEAGGVDYVTKPIKHSEVLARLTTHIKNARLASQNRQAVDAAKLAMLAITNEGILRWQTNAASHLLSDFDWSLFNSKPLPESHDFLLHWINQTANSHFIFEWRGLRLAFNKLGDTGDGTQLILLKQLDDAPTLQANPELIMRLCGLTQREAEVTHWVTLGKTNRDIAEILELSPRTVNKHLEHIFEKLGVETRTAAASMVASKLRQNRELAQ